MSTQLNSVRLNIGNLSIKLNMTQNNIVSLTNELNSLHSLRVFQANYIGNGLAGHNISVPFAPVLVFITDYTAGMQATVYFGVNDTSAYFFRGLQLYEADYTYGGGVSVFYHNGMFDISWIGSAPVGTMNTSGDRYYAIFYG